MIVLETEPKVKKSIEKYPDGRTLAPRRRREVGRKSLTFRWDWDLTWFQEEKKGKSINFKCWANGGLEVSNDLLWRLLDRQDVYHRFRLNQKTSRRGWQDEVANDIAFPMVNIKS
jgi:hypothetical protein